VENHQCLVVGESPPHTGVFTDGWYAFSSIEDRLGKIELALRTNKPIFINTDGGLQELDINEFVL